MNIFKWLKNKSGKLPVTLAQAAGITAVVGAAGFGALTFLSSPSDNNNTFLPPTHNSGEVVYVAQSAGGGQYESNGEVGSSFNAAPSRAIQLANQAAVRQEQARALQESSSQTPSFGGSDAPVAGQTPQAYQLTGADLGQGLGGGKNKNANSSLDAFSTLQNQLSGVTQAINNAQAQAQAGAEQGQAGSAQAAGGQSAAQLASAPRNWGSGGLTRSALWKLKESGEGNYDIPGLFQEVDKSYEKQYGAETYRALNAAHLACKYRADREDSEYANPGDCHLYTHCHGHFFTLEPLGNSL